MKVEVVNEAHSTSYCLMTLFKSSSKPSEKENLVMDYSDDFENSQETSLKTLKS